MRKRGLIAIIMAVFFVLFTLNLFSDEVNGSGNSGQSSTPDNDLETISSQDVAGVYVPE
jgi:hypothetical protein